VKADAARIWNRDPGIGAVKALRLQDADQDVVKRPSNAGAMQVRRDVDGGVDRPAIGRPLAMGRGIGIADDGIVLLATIQG